MHVGQNVMYACWAESGVCMLGGKWCMHVGWKVMYGCLAESDVWMFGRK